MSLQTEITAELNNNEMASALLACVDPTFDDNEGRRHAVNEACKDLGPTLIEGVRVWCEVAILQTDDGEPEDERPDEGIMAKVLRLLGDRASSKNGDFQSIQYQHSLAGRSYLQAALKELNLADKELERIIENYIDIDFFRKLRSLGVPQHIALLDVLRKKQAEEWKKKGSKPIDLDNVFELQDSADLAKGYLLQLEKLGTKLKKIKDQDSHSPIGEEEFAKKQIDALKSFQIEVRLQDGFLAAIYLISGLLSRFDEDWTKFIADFVANLRYDNAQGESRHYRQLQFFTYDCWLLWGPSIQLPGMGGRRPPLQYGFGDEANSFGVWFADESDYIACREELSQATETCPACRSTLTGTLKLDSAETRLWLPENNTECSIIPAKERQILILHSSHTLDPAAANSNQYYSAYIWAAFVKCRKEDDGNFTALHPIPERGEPFGSERPWNGVVPVFVHGNIADPQTYAVCKAQLAYKVMATFDALHSEWTLRANLGYNLNEPEAHFVYCSAFDDNDGSPSQSGDGSTFSLLIKLLNEKFPHF